ncbi:MAG: TldD/PmbA family protein [Balneolaceae bacterium]
MAILTRDEAREIMQKVIRLSKADHCEVSMQGEEGGNIRYARNTVTTSGEEQNTSLSVKSSYGKKSGTASINEFDDDSLAKVVQRSEDLAELAPENPEFMEPLGPQEYQDSKTYTQSTADITPDFRSEAAENSITPSKKSGLISAGFLQDSAGFNAIMNNNGLYAYNQETEVDFSVTIRTEDGRGSGWVSRDYNDVSMLDTATASQIAIDKARGSADAVALEPGKYTVILEPDASVGLLRSLFFGLNARPADEGRSFMSKAGGGTKLGEKMFDERVNVYSDPFDDIVPRSPWTGSGLPLKRTSWIENGVVQNLSYNRFWAKEKEVDPLPGPANAIMIGGDKSTQQLIETTERGILVTRTWYIRMVDPQSLLLTGLTRDGTFYVEDGKIKHAVKNFRFNESPVIMLNNIEEFGKPVRCGGSLIPPMKIRDFTFSSLSDAV